MLILVGGWTVMRLILTLPVPGGADTTFLAQTQPTIAIPKRDSKTALLPGRQSRQVSRSGTGTPPSPASYTFGGTRIAADADSLSTAQPRFAEAPVEVPRSPAPEAAYPASASGIPVPPHANHRSRRWSAAAWVLWRPEGGATSLAPAGRLGGSQAGIRIDYALVDGSPLRPALYGRLSGALAPPVAIEAAVGIALRPTALPLVLGLERRAALSPGGRNDFALIVAGGVYRRPVTHNLYIDGYGQAGIVGISRPDAFADGRMAVEGVILQAGRQGQGDIAIGAALWGGAQPGLARLDIGPQAIARLPVGGTNIRLATEWRQRIAGDARPASGPAIMIGIDF